MDCSNCKFVKNLPSTHHKACGVLNNFTLEIAVLAGKAEIQISNKDGSDPRPAVEVSNWGKAHGWADWPLQFDPIWIDKCAFFTKNE